MFIVDKIDKFWIKASLNPLDIATGGMGDESEVVNTDIVELLELNNLFRLLQEWAVVIGAIVILALIISMHFVGKSERLAEKKADIGHKLLILFIIFSIVWIFNTLVLVLTSIFGG